MKKIYIVALLFCIAFFYSCNEFTDNKAGDNVNLTQVHFSVGVDSKLHDDMQTRASEVVDTVNTVKNFNDQEIKDLWVIQTIDGNVAVAKYFLSINSNEITSALEKGNSEIWFIANTGDSNLFSNVKTLEGLKAKVFNITDSDPENGLAVNGCLRAVGCWKGEIKGNNADYISVSLAPLAAKITLDYEIKGAGEGYGFDNILLMNVPKSLRYCTTTSGTSTKNFVTTGYSGFSPKGSNKQKGRLVYFVTENVPDISNVVNDDPRKKNEYGKNTDAMYLSFQGSTTFKGNKIPFSVSIYPGENTTNDFNIKINHNYHVTLSIDASNGPNNWKEDTRITVNDINIPRNGLKVRYEFSSEEKDSLNSMYESDGTTLLPHDGKYLRNLATGTYSTDRLTYQDFDKNDKQMPDQTFTEGTNYMSYSNCSINTMYGENLTSSDAFTIIYVGGCGQTNTLGWSIYGPTNYGDQKNDPGGKSDGRRWYLVVSRDNDFQYGSYSNMNIIIKNFKYIFDKDDPYIIFSADRNTPNSGANNGGKRDILIDNITAQTVSVSHFHFASNFYLGCNKWESGWVTKEGRVYLFLIYDRTLSTEEINQIRIYAMYKGFLTHQLPSH